MNHYIYEGPVLAFDKIVDNHWIGTTYAVSAKKARCNLAFQFKQETKRAVNAKITLPGKVELVGEAWPREEEP